MNIKQQLYNTCEDFLNNRLDVIQKTIADIQNALQSETKSSAGDKHETGRAMLQLEREKAGQQLAEIERQKQLLHRIDRHSKHKMVAFGSVVKTTKSNYFIAISAGEILLENYKFYAISSTTPIAKVLLSKNIGETVIFRDTTFKIVEIF